MTWRNRITRSGKADPRKLVPNPANWRVHGEGQERVLGASLDQIGYVQEVVVNETTGRLIDGHLRVAVAIAKGERSIPVTYVDLTEAEESLALATLDPITDMASPNAHVFAKLLERADAGTGDLMDFLNNFAQRIGAADSGVEPKERERTGATEHGDDEFGDFEHLCPDCGFRFNS